MRDVVDSWLDDDETADRIAHVEHQPERGAIFDDLDLHPLLAERLAERGIERLYRHQVAAIKRARSGTHTVVVAGTASGKSLCYQVPIAEAALENRKNTALCLFPTKALTQDQFRSFHRLGLKEVNAAVYDGDTETDTRAWVRRQANVVLTNPDMLHIGILPNHARWARFFKNLQYVVVDEVHVLRGIFGSHVANVLRRLRRLAAHYGAHPTFITCSATIGNPADLVAGLTGLPIDSVDQDTSPAGSKDIVIWNPPEQDDDRRRSALAESTDVFVDLVRRDRHTIAFTRSRKGTELVYRWAKDRLDGDRADRIAPYRAGYLAKDRREVEQRLFSGELLGVTATSALELGIDVGGLDAAIVTTFPGTIASFRQQAGRAGRTRAASLAVLVAGEDALDQYFVTHPDQLFGRPAEAAVINPVNPDVLAAHVSCAAYEKPLDPSDSAFFGPELEDVVPGLVDSGDLRVRDGLLWYSHRSAPAPEIDIRTAGGPPFTIIDEGGSLLGTVDEGRVFSQAHPGAVYLHQGDGYVIDDLHLGDRMIVASRRDVGYYTQPHEEKYVEIAAVHGRAMAGRFPLRHGLVEVESHVVGYKRKSINDGSILGYEPLDLPSRRFTTQAVWVEVPDAIISDAEIDGRDLPGTLHAAEHTSIAMLPLYAICDRWDVGGLSTNYHPEVGGAVWFIYDGYPGGAGISPMAFQRGTHHLSATLEALRRCPCASGCPSCVVSPKCGNFNEPLDKHRAIRLLEVGLG